MSKQSTSKLSDGKRKKKQYRVRWLETNVVSGTVYAKSPEEAIKEVKLARPLDDEKEEYLGGAHADSFECVDVDDIICIPEDYVEFLLRTLQSNQVKRLSLT